MPDFAKQMTVRRRTNLCCLCLGYYENFIADDGAHLKVNFRICAQQKVPAKCFKICHISYTQKPKVDFSFHATLYFP